MSIKPVVYGSRERPPRGDYLRGGQVAPDYTCPQNYAAYTAANHETYRRLHQRQSALLPGLACDEFIAALPSPGAPSQIPRFDDINERLQKACGWEIVAVPGLIPEVPFFTLLANRKFPSQAGYARLKSLTASSSQIFFMTCSVMFRCCSTRCLPTTCRPMVSVA